MGDLVLVELLYVTAAAIIAAAGLLIVLADRTHRRSSTRRALIREARETIAFLFDDRDLVHATSGARALLRQGDSRSDPWEGVLKLLAPRFPNLRSELSTLAGDGHKVIRPSDGTDGWIEAEYWDGFARLTLREGSAPDGKGLFLLAAEAELATLRAIGENSPDPIWKEDAGGTIIWANRAYLALADRCTGPTPDGASQWPPLVVFPDLPIGGDPGTGPARLSVAPDPTTSPDWYEVTTVLREGEVMRFATNVTTVVEAEAARQSFVQTLTKTFADLATGLAIFDRGRSLVMFNPALIDMIGLSPRFLSSRPSLPAFLDALRDSRVLPEPGDYGDWKRQVEKIIQGASAGTYDESWALPDGKTYRVRARPHPDGATALLFEDVSSEVSSLRRFRSQIELGQSVLDHLPEAVAVLSPNGAVILSNAVCDALFPAPARDGATYEDWLARLVPDDGVARLVAALGSPDGAERHSIPIQLVDGRRFTLRMSLLGGGNRLVRVVPHAPAKALIDGADRPTQLRQSAG